uniref:Uncharacterized protein n=1 Tax=Kryptolebias marmoratus TaxID=37003 RepID=A0A3Q3FC06_KRYMA
MCVRGVDIRTNKLINSPRSPHPTSPEPSSQTSPEPSSQTSQEPSSQTSPEPSSQTSPEPSSQTRTETDRDGDSQGRRQSGTETDRGQSKTQRPPAACREANNQLNSLICVVPTL